MIHRFHRGVTHLLALSPAGGGLDFGFLTIMLPETGIHIALYIHNMFQNILDDSFLDGPTEEIQLAHRGFFNRRLAANLETDSFTTAEWIKQTLGIGLEFALVMEMYHELAFFVEITDVEFLGIIRHEPVYEAETDGRLTGENREDFLKSPRLIIEILKPADNEILLALDAVLECLACGVHCLILKYVPGFRWAQGFGGVSRGRWMVQMWNLIKITNRMLI
jgi:hypothetical protein